MARVRLAPRVLVLLLAVCLLPAAVVMAAPRDAKVGKIRATYRREGTALHAEARASSPVRASLAYGTSLVVREVSLPWLRVEQVRADREEGKERGPLEGWVLASDTTEPAALLPRGRPLGAKRDEDDEKDPWVGVASFGAGGEQALVRGRPDLRLAFRHVDALEEAGRSMDPALAIAFVTDGGLGRAGHEYARPVLIPDDALRRRLARAGGPGSAKIGDHLGGAGRPLGGLAGGLGNKLGKHARQDGLTPFRSAWLEQVSRSFTPSQCYFLGRALAAESFARYGACPRADWQSYVREVGEALVRVSDRVPANYGGYHFGVLDSAEVFVGGLPGGFVLISSGAVSACSTEDQLAALLASGLARVRQNLIEHWIRRGPGFNVALTALSRELKGIGTEETASKAAEAASQTFTRRVVEQAMESPGLYATPPSAVLATDREGALILFASYYDHEAMGQGVRVLSGQDESNRLLAARLHALAAAVAKLPPYADAEAAERRRARFAARLDLRPDPGK